MLANVMPVRSPLRTIPIEPLVDVRLLGDKERLVLLDLLKSGDEVVDELVCVIKAILPRDEGEVLALLLASPRRR